MPLQRSRKSVSRRRRHDEEGEEEGSIVDGYSVTDGSVSSADEDEEAGASESTGDEETNQQVNNSTVAIQNQDPSTVQDKVFRATADTQAMLNGLKLEDVDKTEEIQFDSQAVERSSEKAAISPKPEPRSQSDHRDSQQRNLNPAFVPNRGGFFLHDDRNRGPSVQHATSRGRGRGFNGGYGRGQPMPFHQPTDRQWAHDLHDSINTADASLPQLPSKPVTAPNRSFSTTTVLGKITVQISLPGMDGRKTHSNVVKKHYTLLPQHRPPLRRDKPVRISIPNEPARYIFPSTERSFIFIPRALRPNQQVFRGGRGRGSWHGSRRNSIFGGSVNTPSVAMSRKSSIGNSATGSGVQTPTLMPPMHRPVVRMPMMNPALPVSEMYGAFPPEIAPIIHSPSASLPMHQPRPQKTVSLADIESPGFKPPQQQNEQPFHQQVPQNLTYGEQPKVTQGTPLAHIPEGAVYAQPFQPYPMMPQGYYGIPYGNGSMFVPQPDPYSMGGPVVPMMQQFPNEHVAHESNGMMYYYDQNGTMGQYPTGMMGMMPNTFFYPTMPNTMFYPQQSGQ